MPVDNNGQLIVALDVETFEQAIKLTDALGDAVEIYKIGSQLFTACGPVVVRHMIASGKKVFLDLKFHDIPNTVANAVVSSVNLNVIGHQLLGEESTNQTNDGLLMLTIHTMGGLEMMQRAAQAATATSAKLGVKKPLIVGITVLTSDSNRDNIQNIVLQRARLAKEAGLDGVVSSSQEAQLIRQEFGKDFIIVTPGIRPAGAESGDQKRVTTPKDAIKNGSNFLVVGRPIVHAADPKKAALEILKEIKEV